GLKLEALDVPGSTARFDLELEVFDRPETIAGRFAYNSDLFDAATVARLSRHLALLVRNLLADPDRPVTDVPMLGADGGARLRLQWNDTYRRWPEPLLAHERFARQAARTPRAEAVRDVDTVLRYGELDRQANQLAHRLRRAGVGPDVLVGICLDRSPQMLAAMLGVLKAGGAYVPLDPGFPPDRIAFMVADSGLPVLLTQRPVLERLDDRLGGVEAAVWCLDEVREELAAESGTAVVLAGRELAADGERLGDLLATSGATVMQATPATWRMLLDAGWPGRPGLRVLVGGEALPEDLAQRLLATGMTLWNMYGPTETTI